MTTSSNEPSENSDGPDVNDVLHHEDDVSDKDEPNPDEPDGAVTTGLGEA